MTYKEAIERRQQKVDLIGKVNAKGFQITKNLIVPSNESFRNKFFQSYIFNFNEELFYNG